MEPNNYPFLNFYELIFGHKFYLSMSYKDFEDNADYVQHGRNGIKVFFPLLNLLFEDLATLKVEFASKLRRDEIVKKSEEDVSTLKDLYVGLLSSKNPFIMGKIRENSLLEGVSEYNVLVETYILKKFPFNVRLEDNLLFPTSNSTVALQGEALIQYDKRKLFPTLYFFKSDRSPNRDYSKFEIFNNRREVTVV